MDIPTTTKPITRFRHTVRAALGCAGALLLANLPALAAEPARIQLAQSVYSEPLPPAADPYSPDRRYAAPPRSAGDGYSAPRSARADDAYRPPQRRYEEQGETDRAPARQAEPYDRSYGERERRDYSRYDDRRPSYPGRDDRRTFSQNEIVDAGHNFFGSVSEGLARAIESLFRKQGRPNGYILGEDASGAFVAGLRYGEGRLYTKDAGVHKVFWQGPSVGYDFGGEGSKTMVLVYNLREPDEIYRRFGGVQGSAYLVGGVGVELQKSDHVMLAPIRSGIGLRLGANVGYLKYTRRPTWNPF